MRADSRSPAPGRSRGFTLLEVLVALAILALALAAAVSGTASQADNAGYLRDRTLAQWVAANRLTAAQLAPRWPAPGSRRGEVTLADRDWAWTLDVEDTPDPAVRLLTATAAAATAPDTVLARVTGYATAKNGKTP